VETVGKLERVGVGGKVCLHGASLSAEGKRAVYVDNY